MNETLDQKEGHNRPKSGKKRAAIEDVLLSGEHVVSRAVIHNGIYWKSLAVLLLSVGAGLVAFPIGVLLAVTAVLMFIHATLKKEIVFLVLTNKRVFVRTGLLQVEVVDMPLSKIESLDLMRMLTGVLMGYAHIVMTGTGQRVIMVPYVANAAEFRQAYNRVTLESEGKAEDAAG